MFLDTFQILLQDIPVAGHTFVIRQRFVQDLLPEAGRLLF
jgi:hypothetical protein